MRLIFVLSLLFLPIFISAQTTGGIDNIEISVSPENPAPNQQTNIRVESYLYDLNRATITWLVDNKQVKSGVGDKSLTLNAPANGKTSTITMVMNVDGSNIRRTVNLKPSDVSIAWEAVGIVPPLYKGKALPSYQGSIKFVAMPELYKNNVRINPEELVYTWRKGSTVLGNSNGYGKQTVTIAGNVVPEPILIRVDVQSKDGTIKGSGSVSVDFYDPEIIFYKEDPLYGIFYNKAIKNNETLQNDELKILAIPYYFSAVSSYTWMINGQERTDLSDQKSILFRNNGAVAGQSIIALEIRGAKNILQSAREDFAVYFNKKEQ